MGLIEKIYYNANFLYLINKNQQDLDSIIKYVNLNNLVGSKIYAFGIYDCLPFNTNLELKNYNIKKNSIFLVEFPQESYVIFRDNLRNKKRLFKYLKRSMEPFDILSEPCNNYSKIVDFNPLAIFPIASNESDFDKRDKVIFYYIISYLQSINNNVLKKDLGDIVAIGGFNHFNILENLKKIDLIKKGSINLEFVKFNNCH